MSRFSRNLHNEDGLSGVETIALTAVVMVMFFAIWTRMMPWGIDRIGGTINLAIACQITRWEGGASACSSGGQTANDLDDTNTPVDDPTDALLPGSPGNFSPQCQAAMASNQRANTGTPHYYVVKTEICTVGPTCSRESVYQKMMSELRFQAPSTSQTPVTDGQQYDLWIGPVPYNPIMTCRNDQNYTAVNVTMPGHFLHPGQVERQVVQIGDKIYVVTTGTGTGRWKDANEFFADTLWGWVDGNLKDAMQNSN